MIQGSQSYDAAGTVTDGDNVLDTDTALSQSASRPVLSVLGILPIGNRCSVNGCLGIALMNVEVDLDVDLISLGLRYNFR